MIISFLRSSSYNEWDLCQHKYFLTYCLGLPNHANKAAEKGSIVHKALELLARRKLAEQEGRTHFEDDEFGVFDVKFAEPDTMLELAYVKLSESHPEYTWTASDYTDCVKWLRVALTWGSGAFSPLERTIVQPEQYFEFTIDEPWACYEYTLPDGRRIKGNLAIKGTLDLIAKQGDGIELIDWKTGKRRDWATGEDKDFDKLMVDPQLRLYYYAACRLYPDIENIYLTIFYTQAGGAFTLPFTRELLPEIENMLRVRFEEIRASQTPSLIWPNFKCGWCHFSKHTLKGEPTSDYNESICNVTRQEVLSLGLDRVMKKRAVPGGFNEYGQGGGRSENTSKAYGR